MKHFMSYTMVEDYFKAEFPTMAKYTKDIHRVSFKPKHGVLLIELKNGCGILFEANSTRENGETKYGYSGSLLSVDATKAQIEALASQK